MDIDSRVELNNGVEMPLFGLGVYKAGAGKGTVEAVKWALEAGYRLIDTASYYGNEQEVGQAVRESGVPREELFVTTKLWVTDHGTHQTRRAFRESFDRLGLDYIDLYLSHWPVTNRRVETWRVLEELYDEGRIKAIGVSNYTIRHLAELLRYAKVVPAVNQVEFHPYLYQKDLHRFCQNKGIQLEAYTPLTRGQMLDEPVPLQIAKNHLKTTAQVFIKWCLQHHVVCIPKSSNRDRIWENADIFDFELTGDEMERLDHLNSDMHITWDPTDEP